MADIRHSLEISAPREVIYLLVSTAWGLQQWWSSDVREVDGAVELGFFNRTTTYRLKLKIDQPPALAEWACETGKEWAGTRLLFVLDEAGKATLVRFTHAGWESETEYFISCTTVWGELMFRLRAVAENQSRGPLFLANSLAY